MSTQSPGDNGERSFHSCRHTEAVMCERVPRLQDVWAAAVERGNSRDDYAVAVIKDGVVVGHVPRKISSFSSLFIRSPANVE